MELSWLLLSPPPCFLNWSCTITTPTLYTFIKNPTDYRAHIGCRTNSDGVPMGCGTSMMQPSQHSIQYISNLNTQVFKVGGAAAQFGQFAVPTQNICFFLKMYKFWAIGHDLHPPPHLPNESGPANLLQCTCVHMRLTYCTCTVHRLVLLEWGTRWL